MDKLKLLPGADSLEHDYSSFKDKNHDLLIILDSSSLERIGEGIQLYENISNKFSVDHHVSNEHFVENLLLKADYSSTCEAVYEIMDPDFVDYNTAFCLYSGIVTDTGVFKYAATSKNTMRIAGELMDKKIPFQNIVDGVFYEKSYAQSQILAKALNKAVLCHEGQCAYTIVDMKDMESCNIKPKDMDGVIDELRLIQGVECAILIYELAENNYKISLRAKNYLNVSDIASNFGGGGHIRAAGGSFEGDLVENLNRLLAIVEERLESERP